MPPKKDAAKIKDPPAAKPGPARIFLVYGSDDLSATRQADEIVNRLCPPEEQAFGLETLSPEPDLNVDGICAVLRNTVEALLTPAFLGGTKTVFLRGAPYFNPRTEPGRFESVKTAVTRLVEVLKAGLPEGVSFVALAPAVDKTTAFYKTCKSRGEVHGFDEPEKDREAEADFIPAVEELLAAKELVMTPPVFAAFLDRTGYNRRQVTAEIEKLSLYLGDRRTVAPEDIQLMVAPMRESKFYEFADTFCSGNLAQTLRVMHRMFDQRVSPVALLVNLQDRLRNLLVMSDCLKRGWARLSGSKNWRKLEWTLPPEGEALLSGLEKDPRKGKPYAVTMLAAQAARYPAGRWFRWFNAAVDAQAAMTGGAAVVPETALELFVTRTLGELTVEKA